MAKANHLLDSRILESAKAEFLEKGFENASLKEICQKAHVTTGALYKRYSGKEELFCAVVSETVEMLTKIEDEKSSMTADTLTDEELISAWEMNEAFMMWWFRLLYQQHDGFVLLIKCAEGTRYSNFQHDWVERMTTTSLSFYQEAFRRSLTQVVITESEMHILLTAFWATIYEPFIHDYSMDEIENHCRFVCRLFNWYRVFGFTE